MNSGSQAGRTGENIGGDCGGSHGADTAGNSAAAAAADWQSRRERSNALALRLMAWIAVKLGRRVARLLLAPITLYYLCFAPAARRHSARYLGRALGRPPRLGDLYRHFHSFASVVLDRIYFVRGRVSEFELSEFKVTMQGHDIVNAHRALGRGAFLLGAHIGSFEALTGVSTSLPGLRVAMVMYPENARLIHNVLKALAPQFELGIIPIGRSGSTLQIRDWLDGGGLVGLLGDRFIERPDGAAATRHGGSVELPFLGTPARFADGPLRLAMLLRRPVFFMVGLYLGGNHYELRFELLADFSQPAADAAKREQQVQAALRAYVARLEALVHEAPYNWFNFFDYWREDLENAIH